MIPSVKTWQVTYWTTQDSPWHGRVLRARVQTINKRFAQWEANERLGYPAMSSHKVTVGLIKGHTWLGPNTHLKLKGEG
jgi:hypothetical protein